VTRTLPLTDGTVAFVDDEDYELVRHREWNYVSSRHEKGGAVKSGQRYLHRIILNCPKGLEIDHINWDVRDNRKENLRVTTRGQNSQNRAGAQKNSGTGIRGVGYVARLKKYRARVSVNYRQWYFGMFDTPQEAEAAAIAGRQRLMTHTQN
jgi:hypothetical protein